MPLTAPTPTRVHPVAPLTDQLTVVLVLANIGFGEAVRVQSVAEVQIAPSPAGVDDVAGATYGQSDGQFELSSLELQTLLPQVVQFKSEGVVAVHKPTQPIIPVAF